MILATQGLRAMYVYFQVVKCTNYETVKNPSSHPRQISSTQSMLALTHTQESSQ